MGLCLAAQNLYVYTNGQHVGFAFADNPKVTFANRVVSVATTNTTSPQQFQLNNVQKFSFGPSSPTSLLPTVEDYGISLFPNPVKDELTLKIENFVQGTTYRIFDINGRLIEAGRILAQQTQIDMQGFTSGNYILVVEQSGRQIQSFKIVKQ
jgi:hypothetical protein